jgi:hypothetical protein
MIHGSWSETELERSDHDLTQLASLHLPGGTEESHQRLRWGQPGVPADIRTKYLPITYLDRYRYANGLCSCLFSRPNDRDMNTETGKSSEAAICPSVRARWFSTRGQLPAPPTVLLPSGCLTKILYTFLIFPVYSSRYSDWILAGRDGRPRGWSSESR